jgi:peptide/nickel transport system ATP-binding protein
VSGPLLEVRDLRVDLPVEGRLLPVLRGVGLSLARGEVLGVVGESGSGKSITARSIMRLLPAGASVRGEVLLDGVEVLALGAAALRRARARDMAMVFQDPRASINPVKTCGAQITEVLRVNRGMDGAAARARALELLELVSISDPERVVRAYPAELSGGMLQRVLIAIALAIEPALIIADEATTSLDVTVQADILAILDGLRREHRIGLMFITHDLELAAAICDRIVVMYAGRIAEEQPAAALFAHPRHPYTARLLAARPTIDARHERLHAIPGRPPALGDIPAGCSFHPRCPLAIERCAAETPLARPTESGGFATCHRMNEQTAEVREILGGER